MSTQWRWDQGRLAYFQFANLNNIAKALNSYDGRPLNPGQIDPLRPLLTDATHLPFRPEHYTVWRNYGRVFSCSLLAYNIKGNLFTSEICKRFSESDDFVEQPDKYFVNVFRNFSYPNPSFTGYTKTEDPVYPFSAVFKFLVSRQNSGVNPGVSVEDIFSYLIGNGVNGTEDIDFYSKLHPTNRSPRGDEERQLREMMIFASQASFLKWFHNNLILDFSSSSKSLFSQLLAMLNPLSRIKEADAASEFVQMSSLYQEKQIPFSFPEFELEVDPLFTEGKKRRVTHLRTERSPALRRELFASLKRPLQCDMCRLIPNIRYVWVKNLLEVHHLLPLSSTVQIQPTGTSLDDVVPVCPNCHRSIHYYYAGWLKSNQRDDFKDKECAVSVYNEAKNLIAL